VWANSETHRQAGVTGGWIGLGVVGVVAGLVSGVAEALGACFWTL
jgi:diacylglycerol kinase (CTP)